MWRKQYNEAFHPQLNYAKLLRNPVILSQTRVRNRANPGKSGEVLSHVPDEDRISKIHPMYQRQDPIAKPLHCYVPKSIKEHERRRGS